MPCYHCGARQTDPVRGTSPWKRGVRHERQVLVCPECQRTHDWIADIDTCGDCGSIDLTCRLGEIECHWCGAVRPVEQHAGGRAEQEVLSSAPELSIEVARALERVLSTRTRRVG